MNGSLLVVVVVLVGAGEFVKLVQCRLDSGVRRIWDLLCGWSVE